MKNIHCLLIVSIIALTSIWGCTQPKSNMTDNDPINLNLKNCKIEDQREFNDIFNVDFVPLETNDSCLIGEIFKVCYANDKIVVLDRNKSKQIFLLDKNGKFINLVGKTGGGPKEYNSPNDISILDDKIYVLSPDKAIQVYTLEEGNYLKTIMLKELPGEAFEMVSNKKFISNGIGYNTIKFWDIKNNIGEVTNAISDSLGKAFSPGPNIFSNNGKYYYREVFADTIYEISPERLIPKITLGSPIKKINFKNPMEYLKAFNKEIENTPHLLGYAFMDDYWLCGVNITDASFKNTSFLVVENLNTQDVCSVKNSCFDGICTKDICGSFKNGIILQQSSDEVFSSMKKHPEIKYPEKLMEIKETDNSVLLMITVKKK